MVHDCVGQWASVASDILAVYAFEDKSDSTLNKAGGANRMCNGRDPVGPIGYNGRVVEIRWGATGYNGRDPVGPTGYRSILRHNELFKSGPHRL